VSVRSERTILMRTRTSYERTYLSLNTTMSSNASSFYKRSATDALETIAKRQRAAPHAHVHFQCSSDAVIGKRYFDMTGVFRSLESVSSAESFPVIKWDSSDTSDGEADTTYATSSSDDDSTGGEDTWHHPYSSNSAQAPPPCDATSMSAIKTREKRTSLVRSRAILSRLSLLDTEASQERSANIIRSTMMSTRPELHSLRRARDSHHR
jgi:hypothetical protein